MTKQEYQAEICTLPFPPSHIETTRLLLRPLTCFDFPALHAIMRKPEVMYAWGHGFTPAETYSWLLLQLKRYREDDYGYFAVILKGSGTLIGQVGLFQSEIKRNGDTATGRITGTATSVVTSIATSIATQNVIPRHTGLDPVSQPARAKSMSEANDTTSVIELGYIFDNPYWHVGYCMESAAACLEYAFSTLNLTELYCFIRPCNLPSIRVAERLGMVKIGEHIKTYRGVELPHWVYIKRNSHSPFHSSSAKIPAANQKSV